MVVNEHNTEYNLVFPFSCLQVQFDYETRKTAYVSPLPSTEQQLADSINGKDDNIYVMPEYVTSFLLSRNVKLQFSGLDSKTVSTAMQFVGGISAGVGVIGLPFSVNRRAEFHAGVKHMTADRTVDGMVIHIPGAQLIGYYTQVMPQFPKLHDS